MRQVALAGLAVLGACTSVPRTAADEAAPPPAPSARAEAPVTAPAAAYYEPTTILSQTDADRLLHTSGITLQWIGWETRGMVDVTVDENGTWHLSGSQTGEGGGEVRVDGRILEIGDGYFTLRGAVSIEDTPDAGRDCRENKTWHFAITQNRHYYRLREFEWCDYLTDYIDIYF